jgi:endonuclease YncB( thermonuclease family)
MTGEYAVHDGTWRVPCITVRVIDADTIVVDADLGWGVWKRAMSVRIDGLLAPENTTAEGKLATEWARGTLPAGEKLTLHSRWVLTFSRVVGSLFYSDGRSYADVCVAAGHGTLR